MFSLILLISLLLAVPLHSAERLQFQPGGVVLYGARSYSGAVISAYQKSYAMNFEVWKPQDLPAGWYATFDGFPVAQIAENRWVYGQLNTDGAIMPTNILVGSVVPSRVPGITRIAAVWSWGKSLNSPEFHWIRRTTANRMGWLYNEYVNTIIAWDTHKPGVYFWLGNKWRKFSPRSSEYTWQMIKRISPYIASELHKNHAYNYGGEPVEAADLARQWGWIWGGRVVIEKFKTYGHEGSGGTETTTTSFSESSTSSPETNDTPQENQNNNNGGQWDVE